MEIYKEGDKSKAICNHCQKKVGTTFKVRTSNIKDGTKTYRVTDILVGVCDVCDLTISVPQQSFAAVGEVRKKSEKESFEVRLPRHLLDILNNSISSLGIEVSSDLRGQLIRLYLASVNEGQIKGLKANLDSELLQGSFKRGSRLSLKVTAQLEDYLKQFIHKRGIKNKTKLIDSLILEIKKDILDKNNTKKIHEIRRALLATG